MKASQPRWLRVALLCRHASATFARIIGEAFQRYGRIDGEQCAASFAYYAFFSLFPLILLLVVVGTFFVPDRLQAAREVVQQVEEYVPLQTKDKAVLTDTIDHAIENGWRAGIFGVLALVWSALRFFQALVIGVNRAWGFKDYNWWKLPLKNLFSTAPSASTRSVITSGNAHIPPNAALAIRGLWRSGRLTITIITNFRTTIVMA
jgi:uncharacterized BrkB/YihY/UPF0761 family membrane protein